MLNAEAAAERQGWAHCSPSSGTGKWLAGTAAYFSGLSGINLYLLTLIVLFICLMNDLK